jgi:transcriptional regulator with XRE-family HTH domain
VLKTRIKELRERSGLSQAFIGKVLAIPQSKVSDLEHGRRHVRLDEAVKLADAFKVEINDLIESER